MKRKVKIPLIITAGLLVAFLATSSIINAVGNVKYDLDYSLLNEWNNIKGYYSVTKETENGFLTLDKNYIDETDSFKILGFTDLHLDGDKPQGKLSLEMLIRGITREKPDLIVFDGDIITASFTRNRANQFASLLEDIGVYWTYSMGNHEHDNNFSLTRLDLAKVFKSYNHCLINTNTMHTLDGAKVEGINGVINVKGYSNTVIQSIYTLDSGQYLTQQEKNKYKEEILSAGLNLNDKLYSHIKDSQVKWYKETVSKINNIYSTNVKSFIFCHIPTYEFLTGYTNITGEDYVVKPLNDISSCYVTNGNVPGRSYKLSDGNDGDLFYGKRRETVWKSAHNSGLFAACKELGSTQAIFCGHDHVNDFVLNYEGITLGYIGSGGYSTYNVISKKENGQPINDHLIQGYTLFEIMNDGDASFRTEQNWLLYPDLQEEMLAIAKK